MLLLSGPPAAGKTSFCLAELRECLRARQMNCRLLAPTSTLAEHLRHSLAREGLVFSPACVGTLGGFIDALTPRLIRLTEGLLGILVAQHLSRTNSGRYAAVRDFPGFQRALSSAIDEYDGAGGGLEQLSLTDADFADACKALTAKVAEAGLATRSMRLNAAAEALAEKAPPSRVWITGFSSFTATEIRFLRAIAERSLLVVTLPDSPAGRRTLTALLPFATEHRVLAAPLTRAPRTLVPANTADGEASDIARRIIEEASHGRPFRDMAVVLRDVDTAESLRGAFERFGIPAQFHFRVPLRNSPAVLYLLALIDAALSGWDHETTLRALRMRGSPLERRGDAWEHAVCARLPGKGLASLREAAPVATHPWFDELGKLSTLVAGRASPAAWSVQFAALTALFQTGAVTDRADQARLEMWREEASALSQFLESAVETAAAWRASDSLTFGVFYEALRTVIDSRQVWPRERRRDVVHVMDAVEARHWRAPIVFICGLVEGSFPRRHSEDPVLPDSVRRRLADSGVTLITSSDRQAEEQYLFEALLARPQERCILTYPRLNAKGEPQLASFALSRAEPYEKESAQSIRPLAIRPRGAEPVSSVSLPELRSALAERHKALSASAVEQFVGCPWQFFANRTLRLEAAPCDAWERLNAMVQGRIAHSVFERHYRDGVPVVQAFDEAFTECCAGEMIPAGYRTEAVRLELLNAVQLLVSEGRLRPAGERSVYEEPFDFEMDGVRVRGKIDRIDVEADGRAVVFDYKYRRRNKVRASIGENEEGARVQGGLYLLGVRALGYRPAGLVYCGFRKEISVAGWVLPPLRPELESTCSESHLVEVMQTASAVAMQTAASIQAGAIAPQPDDVERCERCDYAAVCRFETMQKKATRTAEGSQDAQ